MKIGLIAIILCFNSLCHLSAQNFDLKVENNIAIITNIKTSTLKIQIESVKIRSAVVIIISEKLGDKITSRKLICNKPEIIEIDTTNIISIKIKHAGQEFLAFRYKRNIYLEGDNKRSSLFNRSTIKTSSTGDTTTTTTISSL